MKKGLFFFVFLLGALAGQSQVYRYTLRQLDMNGLYQYSNERNRTPDGAAQLVLYPNPSATGTVTIQFNDINAVRDLKLYDANGNVLKQWNSLSSSYHQISSLASGFYVLQIFDRTRNRVQTRKIVVNRG